MSFLKRALLLSLALISVGLSESHAYCRNGKTYTIKKGKHSSGTHLGLFKGRTLKVSFQFDDSAIYTSRSPENQFDVNKLFGFTDCDALDPQNNSARFGWRWDPSRNRIIILGYVDYRGIHTSEELGTASPGEVSEGTIALENGRYAFYYKGNRVEMNRNCSRSKMTGFKLYPYFGGQETAPHRIRIWLQRTD
jgi:hypothetical protein